MTSNALSVAGFDSSGGAGVLADIKTFEQHKVQGFGVCTAITFQNDKEFDAVKWIPVDDIIQQIAILNRRFSFDYIKIGLIENLEILQQIITFLRANNPTCFILWDPILKASAGFEFHKTVDKTLLKEVLSSVSLVTPNIPEFHFIKEKLNVSEQELGNSYSVFLKGGHSDNHKAIDFLIYNGKKEAIEGKISTYSKHGTGCVLSAAIVSNLAQHRGLLESCKEAKKYTFNYIESSDGFLGFHLL